MNRKNALFAGSDEGGDNWAVIATLIENCKLNGIDPNAWLTATLSSLANGYQATFVSGELVMEQGKATGALPGRLVRSSAA